MTPPPSPRSGPRTRERILDVAARLFVERGYAATSVRDIAAELGIANPSLYHHFQSKAELLAELLAEPLARVQTAVADAERLSGEARTRRVLTGLLEALEVHSGIVMTVVRDAQVTVDGHREIADATVPDVPGLLRHGVTADRRELRITMAVAAVEGAVLQLMRSAPDGEAFVSQLRARREDIVDLALALLR